MAKKKITQKTKNPMPCADPHERAHTFGEVALGYTTEVAVQEATRCILCKNQPCIAGCPVEIDIPTFIRQIAEADFEAAFRTMIDKNVLPAICGRVCPQEEQCEKLCTLGVKHEPVAVGRLERFVADWAAPGASALSTCYTTPALKGTGRHRWLRSRRA
jgi:glutamate synthase (NADPH) small chain